MYNCDKNIYTSFSAYCNGFSINVTYFLISLQYSRYVENYFIFYNKNFIWFNIKIFNFKINIIILYNFFDSIRIRKYVYWRKGHYIYYTRYWESFLQDSLIGISLYVHIEHIERQWVRRRIGEGSRAFAWSCHKRFSVALYISTKFSITVVPLFASLSGTCIKALRQKVWYRSTGRETCTGIAREESYVTLEN